MIQSRIVRESHAIYAQVDGHNLPLYAYMTYNPSNGDYQAMQEAGIRLFCVAVYAGDRPINCASALRQIRPHFWLGEDRYDFSVVDADFRAAVRGAEPGACYLLPRIVLTPPVWWERLHPQAMERDQSGKATWISLSAPEWFADCRKVLTAFRDWLAQSGWDRYVIGWHLAGLGTEEFIRHKLHPLQYADYAPAAQAGFAAWLQQRYGSIRALNQAWHTELPDFSACRLPSPTARAYAQYGELRDAATEQPVIDAARFHSEVNAAAICRLCRIAKEVNGGQQIVGAFYGYCYDIPDPALGHHALRQVLECEAVDFLASPFGYTDARTEEEDWPFQGAVHSAALHGKPWFLEADVRTHLTRALREVLPETAPALGNAYDTPIWFGPDTEDGALAMMGKAFSRVLASGAAIWWFDMWGGWFDTDRMHRFIRQAGDLYQKQALQGGPEPSAQVAVFVDETLSAYCGQDGRYFGRLVHDQLKTLGHAGFPYELYLLSDLPLVDPARFRMAVLLSPAALSGELQDALHSWQCEGRSMVWIGCPGLYGDGMEAATGFANEIRYTEGAPTVIIHPVGTDRILERREDGTASGVLRMHRDSQTYWFTEPNRSADTLRKAAALCGVHVYSLSGDLVYANREYIGVYAVGDGVRPFYLPPETEGAVDLLTGQPLPGNGMLVELPGHSFTLMRPNRIG